MIRAVAIVSLAAALAGCQTVRDGLGMFQNAADKGITVGAGDPAVAAAPVEPGRPALAPGLGGDKANRAYTSDAPKP